MANKASNLVNNSKVANRIEIKSAKTNSNRVVSVRADSANKSVNRQMRNASSQEELQERDNEKARALEARLAKLRGDANPQASEGRERNWDHPTSEIDDLDRWATKEDDQKSNKDSARPVSGP